MRPSDYRARQDRRLDAEAEFRRLFGRAPAPRQAHRRTIAQDRHWRTDKQFIEQNMAMQKVFCDSPADRLGLELEREHARLFRGRRAT